MAYAVRRPVENVYLVRERDRRRSRELFGLALAAVPPVVVLFVAIWANVKTVELGYQLATVAKRREALLETKRKLEMDRAQAAALSRVERRLPEDARPRAPDARPGRAREGRGARSGASACAAARRAPGGALSAPAVPIPRAGRYVLLGSWAVDPRALRAPRGPAGRPPRRVHAPREAPAGAHRGAGAAPRDDRGRGRQAARRERARRTPSSRPRPTSWTPRARPRSSRRSSRSP